jgi:hypothetical protein
MEHNMSTVTCPNCSHTVDVPERFLADLDSLRIVCDRCGTKFRDCGPTLPVTCPGCQTTDVLKLTELNGPITCRICGHTILPFPIQRREVTAEAGHGVRMRLHGSVPREREPELLALALAVRDAPLKATVVLAAGGAPSGQGEAAPAVDEESTIPPEGARFNMEDVPAEFREGGKPGAAVLTAPYLAGSPDWLLRGPYLTKHYGQGKELTTYIKVGRPRAYLYQELLALRDHRDANVD